MTPAAPRFLSAATSEQGPKRGNNQDRVYCDDTRGLFLVVDGMGGHQAGEKAAEIAVEHLRLRLERQTGTVEQRVREAIALANNAIYEAAQTHPEWNGMACVLTVAVIQDGEVTIGHVGDSRLYRLTRGRIQKITHDHSPVGEREDGGELTEAEAMSHPRRNEVFRDVGSEYRTPDDEGFVEIRKIPFDPSSALLLCSDGLSDAISSSDILSIVMQHAGDRWSTVRALFDAANHRGHDNISTVLVEGEEFAHSLSAGPGETSGRVTVTSRAEETGRLTAQSAPWYLSLGVWLAAGLLLGAIAGTVLGALVTRDRQPAGLQVLTVTAPATISAALARARPGDTILVNPGTYTESVRLANGVNLISEPAHEAVVQGSVTAEGVAHARVEGFGIRGAVRIFNSDVILVRTDITGAAEAGIEFSGNSRGALVGSSVHNNRGAGIVVQDAATPIIEHNSIWGNGIADPRALRPGITVRGQARPRIESNVFGSNGAEPIWVTAADATLALRNYFASWANDRRPKVLVIGDKPRAPR